MDGSGADTPHGTRLAGLRVAIVTIYYPPEVSGIAPYAAAWAGALRDAGATVRVITGVPHFPTRDVWPGYRSCWWRDETIDDVRVSRRRHTVPSDPGIRGRALQEATFTAGVLPTVLFDRSDVVLAITPSMSGLLAAVLGRRRRALGAQVQDLTGNAAAQSGTTGTGAAGWIARIEYALLRRARLVGVIAPRFSSNLVEHGVDPTHIRDVPNFNHVTPSTLTRAEARAALGWPDDQYLVVHTGNMGMKQGLDLVCAAGRALDGTDSDVHFVLMGDGNQRPALEAAAAGCTRTRFTDFVADDLYPTVLRAADALLVCERPGVLEMSLPSKLTSYVASGRPIIASLDPDGITHDHVAAAGIAHTVAPGDPHALLAGIDAIRADTALQQRLLDAAERHRTGALGTARAAANYVDFIAELAGRPAATSA